MNAFASGFYERLASRGIVGAPADALFAAAVKRAEYYSAFPNPSMAARDFHASFLQKATATAGTQDPQLAWRMPVIRGMLAAAAAKKQKAVQNA